MYSIFIIALVPALILAIVNSLYWYSRGYRGGKLLFLGFVGFYGITVLLLKLFIR